MLLQVSSHTKQKTCTCHMNANKDKWGWIFQCCLAKLLLMAPGCWSKETFETNFRGRWLSPCFALHPQLQSRWAMFWPLLNSLADENTCFALHPQLQSRWAMFWPLLNSLADENNCFALHPQLQSRWAMLWPLLNSFADENTQSLNSDPLNVLSSV